MPKPSNSAPAKTTPKKAVLMPAELRQFGLEIVKARREKNLSQIALAGAVGISNKTLNHVERGGNWTSVPVLIRLRRTLKGNEGSLLGK